MAGISSGWAGARRSAVSAPRGGNLSAARERGAPAAAGRQGGSERGCGTAPEAFGGLRDDVALGLHLRERVVFHAPRGRERRGACGEAKACEDRTRGVGWVDRGNDPHRSAALQTHENVDGKDALERLRPRKAARTPCGGIEVIFSAGAGDRSACHCSVRGRALARGISELGGSLGSSTGRARWRHGSPIRSPHRRFGAAKASAPDPRSGLGDEAKQRRCVRRARGQRSSSARRRPGDSAARRGARAPTGARGPRGARGRRGAPRCRPCGGRRRRGRSRGPCKKKPRVGRSRRRRSERVRSHFRACHTQGRRGTHARRNRARGDRALLPARAASRALRGRPCGGRSPRAGVSRRRGRASKNEPDYSRESSGLTFVFVSHTLVVDPTHRSR